MCCQDEGCDVCSEVCCGVVHALPRVWLKYLKYPTIENIYLQGLQLKYLNIQNVLDISFLGLQLEYLDIP